MRLDKELRDLEALQPGELRDVIKEAKRLLTQPRLYIREITKVTGSGRYIYLYATWQEEGRTRQKSLGRKLTDLDTNSTAAQSEAFTQVEASRSDFASHGIHDPEAIEFLRTMLAAGYRIIS